MSESAAERPSSVQPATPPPRAAMPAEVARTAGLMGMLDAVVALLGDKPQPLTRPVMHPPGAPRVVRAVLGVMRQVRQLPKDGFNSKDKYSYVRASDLAALLQDAFVDNGLVIGQREVGRAIIKRVLLIQYQFDAYHESGEYILNIGSNSGACRFEFQSGVTDDKSAAKSFNSGSKYFALGLFKIPSVEPDADDDERAPVQRPSSRRIADNGLTDSLRPNGYYRDEYSAPARPPDWEADRTRAPDSVWAERDARIAAETLPRNDAFEANRLDRPLDREPDFPPPDYDAPPPESDAPPLDGPPPDPPPSSPEEVEIRRAAFALSKRLKAARSLQEASRIWLEETDLVNVLPDSTHEFLRIEYHRRWTVYPPTFS